MTQEEKDLLIKDLCSRLPYKTEIQVNDWAILTTTLKVGHISRLLNEDLEIKPYLFPLSSMTEEQKKEEYEICKYYLNGYESKLIDFYHKNHLDYRGLIPMGLALDATGKSIYPYENNNQNTI